jgi:hypothetical protein
LFLTCFNQGIEFIMKTKQALLLAVLALCTLHSIAEAQGTAFTYQGQLQNNGSPANGNYDFTFTLFNTSSTNSGRVGNTLTNLSVSVINGLFTTTLDFGGVFTGANYWLDIGVRTNGSINFTALNPLQELTPTPYAIYAPNAGSAASANSVAASNITGTIPLAQLPATVLTNNETGATLSGAFSGTISGNGINLSNTPAQSYGPLSIPTALSSSGPDSWNIFLNAWGKPGGNSEYWLTNTILALNAYGFLPWFGTVYMTDGTFDHRDTNGNLAWNTNVFTKGLPYYVSLAHSLGVKIYVYTSVSPVTCGGNAGSGISNIYQDVKYLMSLGVDGLDVDNCSTTYQNYQQFVLQMSQAIMDYNAVLTLNYQPAQTFGVQMTMPGSADEILAGQYFGVGVLSPAGTNMIAGGSEDLNPYVYDARWAIQNSWLIGQGHFYFIDSMYNPLYGAMTNWVNLSAIDCQQMRFAMGSSDSVSYTNGGFVNNELPFFQNTILNPGFLSLYSDGAIYPPTESYSNNNTFLWQRPLGSLDSTTRLLCLINTNAGASNFVVNVRSFGGFSNINYTVTEPFSGSTVGNFKNAFSYTVGADACNLLVVSPISTAPVNGSGAGLTSLNASQLTSGTVPYAVLPSGVITNNNAASVTLAANLTVAGNTFAGGSAIVNGGLGVNGSVGIGIPAPSYTLQVNGSVAGVGAYNNVSDERYKTNITRLTHALDKIMALRGVEYNWRSNAFPQMKFDNGTQLGFVAQEIKDVLPEVISQDARGYYSIAYSKVIPVLVEAIKEQQKEMEIQQNEKSAEIQTLKQQNDTLAHRLNELETAVKALAAHK